MNENQKNDRNPRHLYAGIGFIIAGALFVYFGLTADSRTQMYGTEGGVLGLTEYVLESEGGDMEGHTPRGFAGSGGGIFLGDNLNSSFPNTDGVQAFLSFSLDGVEPETIRSAVLASEAVQVRGTPFTDLGKVIVEKVQYDEFSSRVWNTESKGIVCEIELSEGDSIACDVGSSIKESVDAEDNWIQFRLRFERASDGDGEPDLLMFYTKDSNTNTPGLFQVRINNSADYDLVDPKTVIRLPLVLHRVIDTPEVSTTRSREDITAMFEQTQKIWSVANIEFDVELRDDVLDEELTELVQSRNYGALSTYVSQEDLALHVFFFNEVGGPNGIAFPPIISVVADTTTVNDYRATAHEIGHLLSLDHTGGSEEQLMFQGANGEALTEEEILLAREYAESFRVAVEKR